MVPQEQPTPYEFEQMKSAVFSLQQGMKQLFDLFKGTVPAPVGAAAAPVGVVPAERGGVFNRPGVSSGGHFGQQVGPFGQQYGEEARRSPNPPFGLIEVVSADLLSSAAVAMVD